MTNQTSIRGDRQSIKSESDASENLTSEGVIERDATLKQTIKDALSEQIAMANKGDRSETRKLHEIAIKPPIKRPITLALVDKTSTIPLKSIIQRF